MRLVRLLAYAPHGLWQRRGAPAHSLRAFSGVVPRMPMRNPKLLTFTIANKYKEDADNSRFESN